MGYFEIEKIYAGRGLQPKFTTGRRFRSLMYARFSPDARRDLDGVANPVLHNILIKSIIWDARYGIATTNP
jgi:hypothetical protein